MATKSVTDTGIADAALVVTRRAGATQCEVAFVNNAGLRELAVVDPAVALTAPELTAFNAACLKLYNAAVAAKGYV